MCAFKLVDPLGKILIYDQKDKVCINLTHDIK